MTHLRPDYLAWAGAHHGRATYDLATSGTQSVLLDDVAAGTGAPPPLMDDARGYERLRERIAKRHGVAPENVAVALGASHAVWLVCAAMLEPGTEAVVEAPFYEPLALVPRALGAEVRFFERPREDGYRIDPDRVLACVTPRTRLVLVTNLHNPTGVRTPIAELASLALALGKRGATLLVDEVYAPFDSFLGPDARLLESAILPNTIVVSSLTKAFGAGNFRIGWAVGDAALVARVNGAATANIGLLPVELANTGVFLMDHLEWLAARAARLLGAKRARAQAWAASHGLGWSAPTSGLFGLLSGLSSTGKAQEDRIEVGLREHGVLVVPGHFFGVDDGVRLAWSCPEDRFEEGLSRLETVFDLR